MARFEYVNDTIQELYVQTYTITDDEIAELRTLKQTTSPTLTAGCDADDVSIAFTGLVGTLPPAGEFYCGTEKIQYGAITWTSATTGTFTSCKRGWESTTAAVHALGATCYFGDAFCLTNGAVAVDATTIAFDGLDRPGQLPETGVVTIGTEMIWYGGVTYTNSTKTAGNLLYCGRGYDNSTAAIQADNRLIRFEHIFTERESVGIYNYASDSEGDAPMYYGYNPTITNSGTNAWALAYGETDTVRLGCRNRIYAINGSGRGTVAIAEWR